MPDEPALGYQKLMYGAASSNSAPRSKIMWYTEGMIILLDTNVLRNDYLFRNTALQAILREEGLGYRVALPEVVLFEHARHYAVERNQAIKALAKLDGPTESLKEVDDISARELLRQRAAAIRIDIVPVPMVSHEALITRSFRGELPFSDEGRQGYRDALIWETAKVQAETEDVVLLSNDKDFGRGVLAPNLEREAKGLRNKLTRIRTFDAVIKEIVTPRLEELKDMAVSVVSGKQKVGAPQELERRLQEELHKGVVLPRHFLSRDWHDVHFGRLSGTIRITQADVRRLSDKDVLLQLSIETMVDVFGSYWVQIREDEDDVDRELDAYSNELVKMDVDIIATPTLNALKSLTIQQVASVELETDEHGGF
jgi:hypothetical protein